MKRMALCMAFGLFLSIATPAFAAPVATVTAPTYPVYVNGAAYENVDNPIMNYKGSTYLPLAKIAELLNVTYKWNAEKSQVEITTAAPPVQALWSVDKLKASTDAKKLVVALGQTGSAAKIYAFEKKDGTWTQAVMVDGFVGRNGVSSSKVEGDGETPAGVYSLSKAFGVAPDPGSKTPYTQLTEKDFWVDDVKSKYYNTWVKSDVADKDWDSAENLSSETVAYKYAMLINYNTPKIVKGAGSAIFLHCSTGKATAGCVSVPEADMVKLLGFIESDTKIVIAQSVKDLLKY